MSIETNLPEVIATETELDALLARPYPELIELMRRLEGDVVILGIAGKMGLTLGGVAVNAVRESGVPRKIYGVSRFTDKSAWSALEALGVIPLRCDLLDPNAVKMLPCVPNVIFMAGRKFGTIGEEELTWAMNTLVPAHVCAHFSTSRIVAFSTGCVYPLISLAQGGSTELDAPDPVGEYAQSCLGRERMFSYFSRFHRIPICLIRLNYALDLRYGVLHDLATTIWEERPVDRTVGYFNAIWQGDANNQALLSLDLCSSPARVLNLTGPETLSVVETAEALGKLLNKRVRFIGEPGDKAYLNDASLANRMFGPPRIQIEQVLRWTAEWVRSGGRTLGKPTHFEAADGRY